jgi:hypothetical protein
MKLRHAVSCGLGHSNAQSDCVCHIAHLWGVQGDEQPELLVMSPGDGNMASNKW